jgi:hypothetical protein
MRVARNLIWRIARDLPGTVLISASATKVVYKGLLSSAELGEYFADLRDPAFVSRFAVFHQRFSTNTSPQWRLVQPFNYIAHNGEINTVTGNRAWMQARGVPVRPWASDSLNFNGAVDAMLGAGYRIDEAVDMMLSPAVEPGDERLRAYYDAHIPTVEPWDGPAAIVFADGDTVGAALDRSGFRPLRWCRTASGKVLAASETGVVDFGDDPIVERGRLGPGDRLVVSAGIAPTSARSSSRGRSRCPNPRRRARSTIRRSTATSPVSAFRRTNSKTSSPRSPRAAASRSRRWATMRRRRSSSGACRSQRICVRNSHR